MYLRLCNWHSALHGAWWCPRASGYWGMENMMELLLLVNRGVIIPFKNVTENYRFVAIKGHTILGEKYGRDDPSPGPNFGHTTLLIELMWHTGYDPYFVNEMNRKMLLGGGSIDQGKIYFGSDGLHERFGRDRPSSDAEQEELLAEILSAYTTACAK